MFEESKYKVVNYPIRVPCGDYCWQGGAGPICGFFDNTGGHPTCELNFPDLKITEKGYKKSKKCRDLKERK